VSSTAIGTISTRPRHIVAIHKAQQLGARVVASSDSTGFVHDEAGVDVELLKQVKLLERGSLAAYAARRGGRVRFVRDTSVWEVPCSVALPCATQNELTGRDAERLIARADPRAGAAIGMRPACPQHGFPRPSTLPGTAARVR
jgi:glutamate dehydrogenase (NADP+)